MKRFYFIWLFLIPMYGKSQTAAIGYTLTYKIKLSSINSPADAKDVSEDLHALFDSYNQTFSGADTSITIKSSFDNTEAVFRDKLTSYGYNVTYFSKKNNSSSAPR